MSLQSTVALATSPLHDGSGDGSSSEETPGFPAFCLLVQLSWRSLLAIWCFLYCALRVAHLFSTATYFLVKNCLLRERRLSRDEVGAFQL
jgi:hypothetical protein